MGPFIGVGTTAIAALIHGRKAIGAETVPEYVAIAKQRLAQAEKGESRIRPMQKPIYDSNAPQRLVPPQFVQIGAVPRQPRLPKDNNIYETKE